MRLMLKFVLIEEVAVLEKSESAVFMSAYKHTDVNPRDELHVGEHAALVAEEAA